MAVHPWSIVSNSLFRLTLGLAVSLFLLSALVYVVAQSGDQVNLTLVAQSLGSVPPSVFGLYAGIVLINTALRAVRYHLLIRVSEPTTEFTFSALFLVTSVRNMVVDLLPSRTGELIFVGMLKRYCRVPVAVGTAILALSLILDLLVLVPILSLIVLWPLTQTAFREGAVPALILLTLSLSAAVVILGPGLRRFSTWCIKRTAQRLILGRVSRFIWDFSQALEHCRKGSVLGRALLLTLGIRILKYSGLVLLFKAVLLEIDDAGVIARTTDILLALIASEIGASLPVPTFMSFGAYEAGGAGALSLLGYPLGAAVLVLLSVHIASQVFDYAVGVVCALVLMFSYHAPKVALPSPQRRYVGAVFVGLALGLAAVVFFFQVDRLREARSVVSPRVGGVSVDIQDIAALPTSLKSSNAWIVWSSNRFGNHDILRMNLVDRQVTQLTRHPHTETFPRISPDGQRVLFARSREPWVSLRNLVDWDTYLLDIESGKESLVAEHASAGHWSADGDRIYFQRNGVEFFELDPKTGEERMLFRVGRGAIPQGVVFYEPSLSSTSRRLASTWRGSERMTAIVGSNGVVEPVAGGCQLAWGPKDQYLYWIDQGGLMENRLVRRDLKSGQTGTWLDLPPPFSHEYFPRVSADGRWVVLGASAEGHEHDVADYEIFIWPPGRPADEAVRLTFHTGNDNWPDIYTSEPQPR